MNSGSKISRRAFFRQTLAAGGVTLFAYANGRYRMTFANAGAVTYKLRIVHTNDHHARIEPVNVTLRATPTPAITRDLGGVTRRKTLIDQKKTQAGVNGEEFLLIDAGDVFQGTLYFTLFKGQVDLTFYNAMGYEAMAIGNHEFDSGQQTLVDFIKGANFPILSANVKAEPSSILGALAAEVADPAADKWGKRVIITKGAKKIGLFGLTPPDTGILSSPGAGVIFETNLAKIAQDQIDALKSEGADIVIGLTHIGYEEDKKLVPQLKNVNVIVGGHSHTPLRQDSDTTPAGIAPEGKYPTVVNDSMGQPVPIFTDWEWGKWLGDFTLELDDTNKLAAVVGPGEPKPVWAGGLGSPARALLPNEGVEVAQNADFVTLLKPYQDQVNALKARKIGNTQVRLNGDRTDARTRETNLGNLIADALLDRIKVLNPQIAIINGGGIRTSIPAGDVTIGQVLEVLPFGNTIALVTLTGAQVIKALENGVSLVETVQGRFPQVGGLKFIWDIKRPAGSRVVSVMVQKITPSAQSEAAVVYEPINPAGTYRVATNNFMLTGGDDYTVFTQGTDKLDTGLVMADEVAAYITSKSPVAPTLEGRILRVQAYYPFVAQQTMTSTMASTLAVP